VTKKPLHKSKTVSAAIGTLIAFLLGQYLGWPEDVQQAIAALGATAVAVFMRSGIEDGKA
jgi:CBS-domain-containing membrane protein